MCSSLLSDAFGIRNLFFYYFSCCYSALWVSFIWSSILSYCPGKEVREWWNVQFFILSISSAIHLDLKQTTAQAAVVQHEPSYNKFTGTWQRRLFFRNPVPLSYCCNLPSDPVNTCYSGPARQSGACSCLFLYSGLCIIRLWLFLYMQRTLSPPAIHFILKHPPAVLGLPAALLFTAFSPCGECFRSVSYAAMSAMTL